MRFPVNFTKFFEVCETNKLYPVAIGAKLLYEEKDSHVSKFNSLVFFGSLFC